MANFLLFDYDRSIASIGGTPGVEKTLGLPPIEMTGGVQRFMQTVQSVYRWKEVTLEHPVLGEAATQTEKRIVPNENGQTHGLGGIVIDSFTRLAQYELDASKERMNAQREAEGKEPLDNLSRTWWGNYGERLTRCFAMFAKMDATVIATAHEGVSKDDVGKRYHTVNMKGSAADKIPEYFDVVAFLGSEGDGKDKDRYLRVADSPTYRQAKDRLDVLDEKVPFVENGELVSDALARVVQTYQDNGTDYPNILLVGPSGAGKTLLLGTLNPLTNGQA
jgi:hypothetical protein